MSFLWLPAQPITMHLQQKQPETFEWKGRRHRVVRIAKSWRTDWGWWRLRLWRDYYKLVTNTGLLVLVYYDLLEDCWYLQQLYD
jgi:hypothetical protein